MGAKVTVVKTKKGKYSWAFRYYRWFQVPTDKNGEPVSMELDLCPRLPNGGEVTCSLCFTPVRRLLTKILAEGTGVEFVVGTARCSYEDSFDPRVGEHKALGRALRELGIDRKERLRVWQEASGGGDVGD
jgi:hypothetical protein